MHLSDTNFLILIAFIAAASGGLSALAVNLLMKRKRGSSEATMQPKSSRQDEASENLDPEWDSVEPVNAIVVGDLQLANAVREALENKWSLPERFPIAQKLVKSLCHVMASPRGEPCVAMDIWRKSDHCDNGPVYLGLLPGFLTPCRTYCFKWVDGQLALHKALVPRDLRFGPVRMTGDRLGFRVTDPEDSAALAWRDEIVSELQRRGLKSEDRYSDYFLDPDYVPPPRDRRKATPSWEDWDKIAGIREGAHFWDAGVFVRIPDTACINVCWVDGPWRNRSLAAARSAAEKLLPGRHIWKLDAGGATLVTCLLEGRSDVGPNDLSSSDKAHVMNVWGRSRAVLYRAVAAQREITVPDVAVGSVIPAPLGYPDVFNYVKSLTEWKKDGIFVPKAYESVMEAREPFFMKGEIFGLDSLVIPSATEPEGKFAPWSCPADELIQRIADLEA